MNKAERKALAQRTADRLTALSANEGCPVEIRPLFGGWSLRLEAITFAAVMSDGNVMWRGDDQTLAAFENAGAAQFTYIAPNTGRQTRMPYWVLPKLPEDNAELNDWAALALAAARRAAKDKPKKKRG